LVNVSFVQTGAANLAGRTIAANFSSSATNVNIQGSTPTGGTSQTVTIASAASVVTGTNVVSFTTILQTSSTASTTITFNVAISGASGVAATATYHKMAIVGLS
jgi:hypothetical protein